MLVVPPLAHVEAITPPLCQDSSCYRRACFQATKTELSEIVRTWTAGHLGPAYDSDRAQP